MSGTPLLISPCRKCTMTGTHSLRCPTLNLKPGWYERSADEYDSREWDRIFASYQD